jgi:hypothetical protein
MLISFVLHIAGIVLLLLLTPSSAGIPRNPSKDRGKDPRILLSPVPRRERPPLYSLAAFASRPSRLHRRFKFQYISGNRSGLL